MKRSSPIKLTGSIHIVGVAGTGMSALAEILLKRGYDVSGSDRYLDQSTTVPILKCLEAAGVKLLPQDGSGIHGTLQAVVISSAVESDNPDLQTAAHCGIPVLKRAELLSLLVGANPCICVAGTSGKTTTTGMLGWIIQQSGTPCTVVNGDSVTDWENVESSGRVAGSGAGTWILEADESDKSLLYFCPENALITNVSTDHFGLEETEELFRSFSDQVRGQVVCCEDVAKQLGPGCSNLLVVPGQVHKDQQGWFFMAEGVEMRVAQPGKHNAQNALLAAAAAMNIFGISPAETAAALASFGGIRRRLELAGMQHGVKVYDDFAHNPAKIAATWRALTESAGQLIGIWRPHGFGPLAALRKELVASFREIMRPSDHLIVLPVYYAGGTAIRSVSSKEFVADLIDAGVSAEFIEDYDAVLSYFGTHVPLANSTIAVMGARDPGLPGLAHSILNQL